MDRATAIAAAETLAAYAAEVTERARAAGKIVNVWDSFGIHIYGSGRGYITHKPNPVAVRDIIAATEDWLAHDELAELNATLGLAPDGRIAQVAFRAQAQDPGGALCEGS